MNKRILSLFIFFLPFSSFAKDKICHLGDKEIDGVPACGVKVAFFGTVSLSYKYDLSKHSYPLCERFGEENIKKRYTFISTRGEKAGQRLTPEIRRTQKKKECRNKVGDFYKKRFYMVGFEEEELGAALVFSEKVEVEDFKSYYKNFDFKKVEGSELENFKIRLKKLTKEGHPKRWRRFLEIYWELVRDNKVGVSIATLKTFSGLSVVELSPLDVTTQGTKKIGYLLLAKDKSFDFFYDDLRLYIYLIGSFKYKNIEYFVIGGVKGKETVELAYKVNGKVYFKEVRNINDHLTF